MSDLRPVQPRPSIVDRNLDFVVRVVVIGIVVAVLKPWSWFSGPSSANPITGPEPVASPSGPPGPQASVHVAFDDLAYDPAIFGTREPTAHWDLWPAAYLVTYGFVIQLGSPDQTAAPLPVESPAVQSPLASSPPTPRPTPAPTSTPPADGGPSWPDSVTVPAGYHMFLIGIDMPIGYQLTSARLLRGPNGGRATEIPLSHPPAPWPNHFAVLGIPATANADHLSVWTPGTYRLELQFDFTGTGAALGNGHIARAIEVTVEALPGALSSPLPS